MIKDTTNVRPLELTLVHGIVPSQRKVTVSIIYDAFKRKYRHIFGDRRQAIKVLSKHLHEDRVITALYRGKVVGVCCLKHHDKGFFSLNLSKAVKTFRGRVLKYYLLSHVYFDRVSEGELLLDFIAVSKEFRRRGIGRRLIHHVISLARDQGFDNVKLSVIDRNHQAMQLYRRMGFKPTRVSTMQYPFNHLFGYRHAIEMELPC